MGNERWIARRLRRFPAALAKGVTELGAGGGELAGCLTRAFPGIPITACDLVPRPGGLDAAVVWRQGDVLEMEFSEGGVLVANLFLHHFESRALESLAALCRDFDVLVVNEPLRASWPHVLGWLMHPWINAVTRHDLHASLRAGFRRGELASILGLHGGGWQWEETSTWRGALRFLAWRT